MTRNLRVGASAMMRTAVVGGLAFGTGGCLPIPNAEPSSPVVVGQYVHRDGTPAVGARVAITDHSMDATCSRARALAVTDSAGAFRLPATTARRAIYPLVPPIDHFQNAYWLCASAADSVLHMAYEGAVPIRTRARPDSIACLEWAWQGEARVTCRRAGDRATVQVGGRWEDAGATGFYRLIVVPMAWDARKPGVFLQWVERSGTGSPERVRETTALPLAPMLLAIDAAELRLTREGPACVHVRSTGRARRFWSLGPASESLAVALGAPGQMRVVPSCVRADTAG
jgi:hypothetical protein